VGQFSSRVDMTRPVARSSTEVAGAAAAMPLARVLQCPQEGWPMMAALTIGGGLVLVVALTTITVVLLAFELGRLVTQDDEQRQVAVVDAEPVRRRPRLRAQ
jgi:hypothetical protein